MEIFIQIITYSYLIVLMTCATSANACPPEEDFKPCSCQSIGVSNGSLKLDCKNRGLGLDRISQILQNFLLLQNKTSRKLGQIILVGNHLVDRVPDEIRLFDKLSMVDLKLNDIRIIESGAFKFPDKVVEPGFVDLSFNQITHIMGGAFQGQFLRISVASNDLTRFEPSVYQPVLERMRNDLANGDNRNQKVYLGRTNNIDCQTDVCHLAWLIRDDPNLLSFLEEGVCSNGTAFGSLNQAGFNHCPIPKPPIIPTDATRPRVNIILLLIVAPPCIIFLILITILVIVCCKYKKKQKAFRGLKALLDGNPKAINHQFPMSEQIELLSYDKKLEFPKNRLRLGIELGSGAFGRVVKADAVALRKDEPVTTIAVKMIKNPSVVNTDALAELVGEIKVMQFLGLIHNLQL